jgi:peptidoglycan/LPS O-acetylase OafA/YrhL
LLFIAAASVLSRLGTIMLFPDSFLATAVLIPNRADVLIAGLLAAVAIKNESLSWRKIDPMLPIATIGLMMLAMLVKASDSLEGRAFAVLAPLLVPAACAAFLISLVRGAHYAKRFGSRFLLFFNETSYAVYLTHLPVLGLMHGWLLGTRPDIATPVQWTVTIAAMPVCVAVAWILTKLVEQPITAYGRTWTWSGRSRSAEAHAALPRWHSSITIRSKNSLEKSL